METQAPYDALRSVPDEELIRRLNELVSESRRVEADLVAHIGEVDERKLFLRLAFPSMFAYCIRALHLSEPEAYRRIRVARAARRFEGLLEMLRDGRLHLTGMALVVPLLTSENRDSVLARVTHRSKREIQKLVAEFAPKPDVPSGMRRLPQRRSACGAFDSPGATSIAGSELLPGTAGGGHLPATAPAEGMVSSNPPRLFPETVAAAPPAVVQPLSPARYKVQFTASQELHDKLERLIGLMRSQVPDGDLAAIIECAVSEKLDKLEARRFGKTTAPRKQLQDCDTSHGSRYVPAAVRRVVHDRDDGRCRFVDEQGHRCPERLALEFHHRRPFGLGGDRTTANISLLCGPHNRYLAEVDYGRAAIRRARAGREAGTQGT